MILTPEGYTLTLQQAHFRHKGRQRVHHCQRCTALQHLRPSCAAWPERPSSSPSWANGKASSDAAAPLLAELRRASTWGAALQLVVEHETELAAVHAAHVLQFLAKSRMLEGSWQRVKLHQGWPVLLKCVHQQTQTIDASSLGSIICSLGMLRSAPEQLLADLEARARSVLGDFDAASLGACLEGFSHGHRPASAFLDAAESRLAQLLPSAAPQHVSTMLRALADLKHRPGDETLQAAAEHLAPNIQQLPLASLVSLTWALVDFGLAGDPSNLALLEAIAERARKACTLAMGNCTRMGHSPKMPFASTRGSIDPPQELVYRVDDVMLTLQGLARLALDPGPDFLLEAAELLLTLGSGCTAQAAVACVEASARFGPGLHAAQHWQLHEIVTTAQTPAKQALAAALLSLAIIEELPPDTWEEHVPGLLAADPGDDLLAYTAQARRVLHAWLLLQCQEDAAGYELPEPWLHIALQEFQAVPSAVQRPSCAQASAALTSLGMEHTCQAATPNGLLLADVLVHRPAGQQQVALMLEPPSCYACNTGTRRGECVARDRLFRACHWKPCIIPESEWQLCNTPEAQQALLVGRLRH